MNKGVVYVVLIFVSYSIYSQDPVKVSNNGFVKDMDISPQGTTLVLAYDRHIEFINFKNYALLGSAIIDEVTDITKVAFLGDSSRIVFADRQGAIYCFELPLKKTTKIFQSNSIVTALSGSPTGMQLAFGTKSGTLTVLNLDGLALFETAFSSIVSDIKYNSNGRLLAAGDLNGNVVMTDFNQGGIINREYKKSIRSLAFDESEKFIVSFSKRVIVNRIDNQSLIEINHIGQFKQLSCMVALKNNALIFGTYSGNIKVDIPFGVYSCNVGFSIKEIIGKVSNTGAIDMIILGFNGEVYSMDVASMKFGS